MEITGLPTTGCNVFNGTYVDNYNGNVRTRYYIYDGTAVASTRTTNTSQPTGSICMTEIPEYKPELQLYTGVGMAFVAFLIVYICCQIIIGRLIWRK